MKLESESVNEESIDVGYKYKGHYNLVLCILHVHMLIYLYDYNLSIDLFIGIILFEDKTMESG